MKFCSTFGHQSIQSIVLREHIARTSQLYATRSGYLITSWYEEPTSNLCSTVIEPSSEREEPRDASNAAERLLEPGFIRLKPALPY